jgi:galactose-1-phosphate uridylyltransferase
MDSPTGKEHLEELAKSIGGNAAEGTNDLATIGKSLFFSSHDLIVSRKHFTSDGRNMGSGEMTWEEHYQYFSFVIDAAKDIYCGNRFVEYVVVFQNWLWQAGATLDHLHKQIVGIDEYGLPVQRYLQRVQENPQIFRELWDDARQKGNIVAENEHAIALVEYGRRYPTVGVYAKRACHLADYSSDVVRDVSNLVHACHAALGPDRSTNEEWYYTPPREAAVFPWHVLILLRTNIQAGFEHATRIYINSYRPWELRSELENNMNTRKGHIAPVVQLRDALLINEPPHARGGVSRD